MRNNCGGLHTEQHWRCSKLFPFTTATFTKPKFLPWLSSPLLFSPSSCSTLSALPAACSLCTLTLPVTPLHLSSVSSYLPTLFVNTHIWSLPQFRIVLHKFVAAAAAAVVVGFAAKWSRDTTYAGFAGFGTDEISRVCWVIFLKFTTQIVLGLSQFQDFAAQICHICCCCCCCCWCWSWIFSL